MCLFDRIEFLFEFGGVSLVVSMHLLHFQVQGLDLFVLVADLAL
jgi:hypothetical protein